MKRMVLIGSLLLVWSSALFCQSRINIDYNLGYTDNAYNLSDRDLDRYEDSKSFSYLKTSDDVIQTISLKYLYTYKSDDYRLTPSVTITQDNYFSNREKDNIGFSAGCNMRLFKLYADLRYAYAPQNYTQRYEDKDVTQEYEKFEYEKDMYKLSLSYPITRNHSPLLYFKYETYYHNKYFVEYDGNALTSGIGWQYKSKIGDLTAFYYYRSFKNESDNKDMQDIIDNEYDSSYDTDIYELNYSMPRIYTNLVDYSPFISMKYQNDYYLSEISPIIDTIHATRKDKRFNINIGSLIYFSKNINFQLDLLKELRRVNSENVKLKDSKNYDKTQVNCGISWSFNFSK